MGFLDDAKGMAEKAVDSQGETIGEGLDKAGAFIDDKTGGKFGDQIQQGTDMAKDQLDKLDGQNDDIN